MTIDNQLLQDEARTSVRVLAVAVGVSAVGNGLWLAAGVLFLVRSAGLSPVQVGVGLTVGGLVGVVAGVPIGAWADRRSPRRVGAVMLLLEAAATAGFALVHSFPMFLVTAAAAAAGLAGSNAARGAVLGQFGAGDAARGRALIRAVANAGISLGTLAAGVVLAVDTRAAYLSMILVDTLTFVVAAALYLRLPQGGEASTTESRSTSSWRVLGDVRYVAVTGVNAVMTFNYAILTVALPLWIVSSTSAPRWLLSPLFVLSTMLCVLFQVRAARDLEDPARAARAMRRAGALFAAGCVVFSLAGLPGRGLAVALLVGAVLLHTGGELLQAGSSFGLSFALAPPGRHGQYQGVWGAGVSLGESAAPVLLTLLVTSGGGLGWLVIAGLLGGAGMLMPSVARWAAADVDLRPVPERHS